MRAPHQRRVSIGVSIETRQRIWQHVKVARAVNNVKRVLNDNVQPLLQRVGELFLCENGFEWHVVSDTREFAQRDPRMKFHEAVHQRTQLLLVGGVACFGVSELA